MIVVFEIINIRTRRTNMLKAFGFHFGLCVQSSFMEHEPILLSAALSNMCTC
jgi:hypothetical protein